MVDWLMALGGVDEWLLTCEGVVLGDCCGRGEQVSMLFRAGHGREVRKEKGGRMEDWS